MTLGCWDCADATLLPLLLWLGSPGSLCQGEVNSRQTGSVDGQL
jgi:hypothetical protein